MNNVKKETFMAVVGWFCRPLQTFTHPGNAVQREHKEVHRVRQGQSVSTGSSDTGHTLSLHGFTDRIVFEGMGHDQVVHGQDDSSDGDETSSTMGWDVVSECSNTGTHDVFDDLTTSGTLAFSISSVHLSNGSDTEASVTLPSFKAVTEDNRSFGYSVRESPLSMLGCQGAASSAKETRSTMKSDQSMEECSRPLCSFRQKLRQSFQRFSGLSISSHSSPPRGSDETISQFTTSKPMETGRYYSLESSPSHDTEEHTQYGVDDDLSVDFAEDC